MSTDRWMDEEEVVHIYNGILLSHKKEQNGVIYRDTDRQWQWGPQILKTKSVSTATLGECKNKDTIQNNWKYNNPSLNKLLLDTVTPFQMLFFFFFLSKT